MENLADYTPRFADGRPMFVGLRGEALSAHESGKLLADIGKRRVARTIVKNGRERVHVSTVFLVLDHGFLNGPELYETMVFGGPDDGMMNRYATRIEALAGHYAASLFVRLGIDIDQRNRARRRRMHTAYRQRRR